jgi:hypothetical protein
MDTKDTPNEFFRCAICHMFHKVGFRFKGVDGREVADQPQWVWAKLPPGANVRELPA